MTSPSNSHPGGAAAGSGGMLTAEQFDRYGLSEGTIWRKSLVADRSGTETEMARVRTRLAELDAEQRQLLQELSALEARQTAEMAAQAKRPSFENAPVTNMSTSGEKVELFRNLFAGRPDVFPVRWENRKTGRAGYSPACFNEWVKGICGKPTVKCGDCKHQLFIPHSPSKSLISLS